MFIYSLETAKTMSRYQETKEVSFVLRSPRSQILRRTLFSLKMSVTGLKALLTRVSNRTRTGSVNPY